MSKIIAQDTISFYGRLGSGSDAVMYYFDNKKTDLKTITTINSEDYSLKINPKNHKTINLYYKRYEECPQVVYLDSIRKYNKKAKVITIQNDLFLVKGFACARMDCDMSDDKHKLLGTWIGTNMTLELDCYYKKVFYEDGYNLAEEGNWYLKDNQIEFEPVYVRNLCFGTYIVKKGNFVFNIKSNYIISDAQGNDLKKNK